MGGKERPSRLLPCCPACGLVVHKDMRRGDQRMAGGWRSGKWTQRIRIHCFSELG